MSGFDLDTLVDLSKNAGAFALSPEAGRLAGRTHGVRGGTVADIVCTSDAQAPALFVPDEGAVSDADDIEEIREAVTRAKAAREPKRVLDLELRRLPLEPKEAERLVELEAKAKGEHLRPAEDTELKVLRIRRAGMRHADKHGGQALTPKQVSEIAAIEIKSRAVASAQDRVFELLAADGMPIPTNKSKTTWMYGGAMAVQHSGNEKISDDTVRNTATTYAAISQSCPVTCVQRGVSCYAETSNNIRPIVLLLEYLAARLGHGGDEVAEDEARCLDATFPVDPANPLRSGIRAPTDLRIHTVGDSITQRSVRTVAAAADRWISRSTWLKNPKYKGVKKPIAWSYTHAFADHTRDDWGNVSVLGSVSSPTDLPKALAAGFAPTCVVAPEYFGSHAKDMRPVFAKVKAGEKLTEGVDYKHAARVDAKSGKMVPFYTPDGSPIPFTLEGAPGVKWIPCPAQNPDASKRMGCVTCRICLYDHKLKAKALGVAFMAHASGKVRGVPFHTAEFNHEYNKGMEARRAGQQLQKMRAAVSKAPSLRSLADAARAERPDIGLSKLRRSK